MLQGQTLYKKILLELCNSKRIERGEEEGKFNQSYQALWIAEWKEMIQHQKRLQSNEMKITLLRT
jgi:hypothetical protein